MRMRKKRRGLLDRHCRWASVSCVASLRPITARRVRSGHGIKRRLVGPRSVTSSIPASVYPPTIPPSSPCTSPSLHCSLTDLSALIFLAGRFDRSEGRNGGMEEDGKGRNKGGVSSFLCMCVHVFDRTRTWVVRLKGVRAEREEDDDKGRKKQKCRESEREQIEWRKWCGCL